MKDRNYSRFKTGANLLMSFALMMNLQSASYSLWHKWVTFPFWVLWSCLKRLRPHGSLSSSHLSLSLSPFPPISLLLRFLSPFVVSWSSSPSLLFLRTTTTIPHLLLWRPSFLDLQASVPFRFNVQLLVVVFLFLFFLFFVISPHAFLLLVRFLLT